MRDDAIVRFLSAVTWGFKLEFSSFVVSATAGETERLQCRTISNSNPVVTVATGGLSLCFTFTRHGGSQYHSMLLTSVFIASAESRFQAAFWQNIACSSLAHKVPLSVAFGGDSLQKDPGDPAVY